MYCLIEKIGFKIFKISLINISYSYKVGHPRNYTHPYLSEITLTKSTVIIAVNGAFCIFVMIRAHYPSIVTSLS